MAEPSREDRIEASAWLAHNWPTKISEGLPENLATVLAAAREEGRREERERCAKIADRYGQRDHLGIRPDAWLACAQSLAAAIRDDNA